MIDRLVLLALVATLAGCSGGGGGGSSNDAPDAVDDVASTDAGTAVAVDVLANDADSDDDALTIVAFTNGSNGTATLTADGTMSYVPAGGFTGTDTFTYEVSDGDASSVATVTITVTPIADLEESAEPNEVALAGTFALPTTGGEPVVVNGCIDPPAEDEGDYDPWEITVTEPAVMEVSALGVGGLVPGFVLLPDDATLNALDWNRLGIDFAGDTASRQVFLPVAGSYYLLMYEARELLIGAPAGSPTSCYFTSVGRVPATAPITGTLGAPMAVPAGDVPAFVDFTPSADGQSLSIAHTIDDSEGAAQSSVLALVNGVPVEYGESNFIVAALDSSDTLRLVVEPRYDFTLGPREVTLHVTIAP